MNAIKGKKGQNIYLVAITLIKTKQEVYKERENCSCMEITYVRNIQYNKTINKDT